MDAHRSRPTTRPAGRHFLSPRLAAEFVGALDVGRDELVVEVGAGTGRLTRELCERARLVWAVELDPVLARRLLSIERHNLLLHRGDVLASATPGTPYRVVGNAPFGIGTDVLHRFLEDDRVTRLDLILQREAAHKRADGRGNVLAVRWGVRWRLTVPREFPRTVFHPPPRVDAAWLRAIPRPRPLLSVPQRARFDRFLRDAFSRGATPLARRVVSPSDLVAVGVDREARAKDLVVETWVRLFERVSGSLGA